MAAAKKRTRRAVKARRTLEEHEATTERLLYEWEEKFDRALSKVRFYRRELKKVRAQQAKARSKKLFGSTFD